MTRFRSAITVCLVAEASAGPFVFHNGLTDACEDAARFGFDAIEIFPPDAFALDRVELTQLLKKHNLSVAAVGTGAGWVKHKLSLTHVDPEIRRKAIEFIGDIIRFAGQFKAPAIIGSMQGRVESPLCQSETTLAILASALRELSDISAQFQLPLLYEPLNRYETNIFNRMQDTVAWLESEQLSHVKILADLFHMNIEEANLSQAIRDCGKWLGHVHFADSNRKAIGLGHTPIGPIIESLSAIEYRGYLSAEIFPLPSPEAAAEQTIRIFESIARC
jgi:sugar phosphate isomerase/epimerase